MKIRSGSVTSKPVYLAVGVDMDGRKDVLGVWAGSEGEGATTVMAVLSWLRSLQPTAFVRGFRRRSVIIGTLDVHGN
ncbi:transposase [Streptomyces sp. NBC_01551]|uniref:transposase n=1 Tax=Streptomyces sp. NBC_01551 TaxID=2975876 RepID=UPI002252C5AA|nr:transposase [Streptomyces sp. NBC_01551]MCX4529930.1 transposase [Streptomyces sp. NBC_01551]